MDVREKLVELLDDMQRSGTGYFGNAIENKKIADYLISNGITMDVREKTAGLDYEAEYNRLKDETAKRNEENTHLREELKNKEKELRYYYGFEAACKLIFGRE